MLERAAPYFEKRIRNNITDAESLNRFLSRPLVKHYLHRYRLLKLKRTIGHCYHHSPFYHELFKKNKILVNDIRSFHDLSRIPFTIPDNLRNPDQFFAVPSSRFTRVFSTSGTTGKPKIVYFTKNDLENQISRNATGLQLLYGITEGDRVRLTYEVGFEHGDWGIRFCFEHALHQIGAMSIVTGCRLKAEDELQILKKYQATVLAGTTTYVYHLTREMEKLDDLKAFKLKNLMIGSEPLTQAIREKLEESWMTKAYQGYGLTELGTSIAGECKEQDGMHVTESDFFVEVVDPKTGEQLEEGEIGEITVTTLDREGMPLLRYQTHDLGVIMPEDCPCGLPFRRIKIKGRTDNMVPIGSGDNLFPTDCDEALLQIPEVIDYQIIVQRKKNIDHLIVIAETTSSTEKTRKKILNALMTIPDINDGVTDSRTILPIEVQFVKPDSLDKTVRKAKRIIDKRNLYE